MSWNFEGATLRTGDFLQHLRRLGVELSCDDDRLVCKAPKGVMTPELKADIQQRKYEILEMLKLAAEDMWNPLVKIQPLGDRPPIFIFHGVGGNVLNYKVLVQYLDPGQPLYGLQAKGIDGLTEPLSDIPTMARLYVAEIQRVQPEGPYLLGGGSMGGALALEAARQLQALGQHIGLLLLIDTLGPNYPPRRRVIEVGQLRHRPLAGVHELAVRSMFKLRYLIQRSWRLFRCRQYLRRGIPLPHGLRFWYLENCHFRALRSYHCRSYDGRLTLIRGDLEPEGWFSDPQRGWAGVASEGLEVIAVPGDHSNLIEQPQLGRAVAQLLQALKHSP